MRSEGARVRDYWQERPCSEEDQRLSASDPGFYREQEVERYRLQPFIPAFAEFGGSRRKRVLEIGVGMGADHACFARAGAKAFGVDVTWAAIVHTRNRMRREGLAARLAIADSLGLPFAEGTFDVVYSFGVLHHTPDPASSCAEASRVVKSGGVVKLMLYNRRSLVGLQVWLAFGLLKGRPFTSLRRLIADHMESPGTQAYARGELPALLPRCRVRVRTVVTPYDCRIGRRRYLPRAFQKLIPPRLGWNHLIEAVKE